MRYIAYAHPYLNSRQNAVTDWDQAHKAPCRTNLVARAARNQKVRTRVESLRYIHTYMKKWNKLLVGAALVAGVVSVYRMTRNRKAPVARYQMKRGVIAYVDFLGTKAIWKKHEAAQVLSKLRHLRDKVLTEHLNLGRSYLKDLPRKDRPSIQCQAIFVSDTIAVAFWYDSPADQDMTLGALVYIVGKVIAELIRESASITILPTRILRGCITEGEFDFDESFLIGPAVDDAGACHEQAAGALVFLSPPADKRLNEAISYLRYLVKTGQLTREEACTSTEALLFIPHEVPLKTGTVLRPVLNPLAGEDDSNRRLIMASILSAFDGDTARVREMKANTETFLNHCSTFSIEPLF